jgi:hypothetical protein
MQAYEFSTAVEDHGIIHIPKEYLKDITCVLREHLNTNSGILEQVCENT